MQKRVAFTTIKDSDVQPKETLFSDSSHLKKDKKSDGKTHRFVLKLPETTDDTFPEYSYLDLLKSVDGSADECDDEIRADDDPFNAQDEAEERKLKEIAKKFEAKYGPKSKSYIDLEDFIDKGMGYDENDPFIDNEEAYDELIPSTLTTKYGGFYINCGQLDFKPLCEEEEDENKDSDEINKPVIKKRKRDIDSQVPGLKRKRLNNGGKLSSLVKAKRDKYPGGTVAQLLKQEKQKQQSLLENVSKGNDGITNFKPKRNVILDDDEDEDEDEVEEVEKDGKDDSEIKVKVNAGSIDSVIESVVKGGNAVVNGTVNTNTSGNSSDGSEGNVQLSTMQFPKLPDQLPSGLSDALDKIKELRLVNFEGKQKFFKDNDVNKVLLDIEIKCREQPNNIRHQVYTYLSSLLPYTKETLMKRGKKLRLESEENKIHLALASLRDEVAKIMSEIQKQYHENHKSAMSLWDKDTQNGKHPSEEGSEANSNVPKTFKWSERARCLLKNVVNIKKSLTDPAAIKNQSEDEYLGLFFESEVKPIWPKGWISTKTLMDEYQSSVKSKPTEVTVCSKVQTSKPTPAISFIKKPQPVPQSSITSSGLVNTSSTGIVLASQSRAPVLATVNPKSDRTTGNKSATNTPVNLSSKETDARHHSAGNATSKPEGLMCSVDKFITTAISSATAALPKSSKAASPPPNNVVISSTNAKCVPVVTSAITYVGQSSRSSPNSLLSKSNPSNTPVVVSGGTSSQQRQKQQSLSHQATVSQSHQQQPQSQSTSQRSSQKSSKLEVANLSFTNQALEKIIKNSLGNYPNSNPSSSEKTQSNQRTAKVQQQIQQQSCSQQQSKHFPGIEYAFEHEICKSLSEGKNNQRQESKSSQLKQVQQTQQASAVTSRSSPLPPFQRSTSVPSVKPSLANTKTTESKPMVTISPVQQQQINRSVSQSTSTFNHASHPIPVNSATSTTPYASHNIAQLGSFLFGQNAYSYPTHLLNNYNLNAFINASQAAVTTSSSNSSNSQYQFNLMHHTYAAPPPSGDGRR
ncbi:Ubinuclein-2-like protein [Leptotrombidium deliense]|uniref:Ubinuclein-2-like protein n=1 Tax=Leptotrombidium deliense TaxID=299467 RepID=A0A443SKJ5_9ACAR|nr:Ubinuclein-2-like protein [Leptotrombidium deliense]